MWLKCIAVIFLMVPLVLSGEEELDPTGALIVSYQTGPKAERLERIRFWLKDAENNCQLYPKGDAYVDEHTCLSRIVVIEELPPGKYTLTFVVPNSDNLFENILSREVEICPDCLTKVDQTIKPRYASLRASVSFPSDSPSTAPVILYDKKGIVRAQANSGKLMANYLAPGTYTLTFAEVSGYYTPEQLVISVGPDESVGPYVGNYVKLP